MASSFRVAVRSTSGAQAYDQGGAVLIAGLAEASGRQVLREGYAQGILSGRAVSNVLKTCALTRPERYRAIARPEGARPYNYRYS